MSLFDVSIFLDMNEIDSPHRPPIPANRELNVFTCPIGNIPEQGKSRFLAHLVMCRGMQPKMLFIKNVLESSILI